MHFIFCSQISCTHYTISLKVTSWERQLPANLTNWHNFWIQLWQYHLRYSVCQRPHAKICLKILWQRLDHIFLKDVWRHFGLSRVAAHCHCCFAPCIKIRYYLLTYQLCPCNLAVMGKSKSWFDLNHDWITGDDLIWVQKIWFGNMSFGFDLNLCDLIWWFEQITTFSNLGQGIMITLLVFLLQLS